MQISRPRFVVGLLVVALTAAFAFAQPARADDANGRRDGRDDPDAPAREGAAASRPGR